MVRVCVVDDSPVVVAGLTAMLRPFADRISLVPPGDGRGRRADVVLHDPFVARTQGGPRLAASLSDRTGTRVVAYCWLHGPDAVARAFRSGYAGYLSKTASAAQLVRTVRRVAAGELGVCELGRAGQPPTAARATWPGQEHGLSRREAEIVALICQGATNQAICERSYLSPNTVKTYIRAAYRKLGITRRPEAVRWGIEHGLLAAWERAAPGW